MINMTKEQFKEFDDFMYEYYKEHSHCPKCGSKKYKNTLRGYDFFLDRKEEYKDLNTCICGDCGDVHTLHERIRRKHEKIDE
jgi:transcription elongation factor Elf1